MRNCGEDKAQKPESITKSGSSEPMEGRDRKQCERFKVWWPIIMSFSIDPPAVAVAAEGGISSHTLSNAGEAKVTFKVKCSNINDYRFKPVYGFVDPAGSATLEITRNSGPVKEDKLVIQWAAAPADATDAKATFPSIPPDQIQSLTVPISASWS